jgi:signal peptidase
MKEEISMAEKKTEVKKQNIVIRFIKFIPSLIVYLILLLFVVVVVNRLRGSLLPFFGNGIFVVRTGSMSPTIDTGSLLIVTEAKPSEFKEGDILTYKVNSDIVTHRIREIRIGEDGGKLVFITRGDANNVDDRPVYEDAVIGRVLYYFNGQGIWSDPAKIFFGIAAVLLVCTLIYLLIKTLMSKDSDAEDPDEDKTALDGTERQEIGEGAALEEFGDSRLFEDNNEGSEQSEEFKLAKERSPGEEA